MNFDGPVRPSVSPADQRAGLGERVTSLARARDDVVGLALVGSVAHQTARDDSDVDVILLVDDRDAFVRDEAAWLAHLTNGAEAWCDLKQATWGVLVERRFVIDDVDLDLGVVDASWASLHPIDDGTRRVIADGARVLVDKRCLLAALIDAVTRA